MIPPELFDFQTRLLSWRTKMLLEASTLAVAMFALWWYGAPAWAHVLVFYASTRSSRISAAADVSALQSTYRVRLASIEDTIDRVILRLDKWKMGRSE